MKQTKRSIRVPIYPSRLVIIMTDNIVESGYLIGCDVTDRYNAFVTVRDEGLIFAVFDINSIDNSIIAHECVHIVSNIFKDCGATLDANNDEPMAYLLQWAFKEVEKVWKKY